MERHYDAFISYRHAPLDSKVAADIQNGLERFPIPKALQKSHSKRRIGPIFRDKEELPTSSNLSEDIEKALKNSDYLIVICSTHTAESIWVQREIEIFIRDHGHQHIFTVLADGEPQDVIPDILCHEEVDVQGEDGTIHTETRKMEPLSCDYRVKRSIAKREELPRLAAAILDCPYDELRQRQRRRQVRQMASAFSAALLLVTAVAIFAINRAVVIARQAEQIEEEYRSSLINQSRYLAEKSGQLLEQGDRIGAIQVALAALPASKADDSRPLVTEALYALNNAVYPYHVAQTDEFLPKCMLKTDGTSTYDYYADSAQFSPNETRWLKMDDTGQVFIFDLEQDTQIAVLAPRDIAPADVGVTIIAVNFVTEDRIALYLEYGAVCWDLQTNSAVWTTIYDPAPSYTYGLNGPNTCSVMDVEHNALVVLLDYYHEFLLLRLDASTGEVQAAIHLPDFEYSGWRHQIALSPDGTKVAVGIIYADLLSDDDDPPEATHLLLADLESETYQLISTTYADVAAVDFLPNGQVYLLTTDIRVTYYTTTISSYAVEVYNFEDGSLVWSSPGEISITRDVEDTTMPSSSIQFWHRELDDGNTQDLIVAQLAGHVFVLDLEGKLVRMNSFLADILDVFICDASGFFLPLRNGKIMFYAPANNTIDEIGDLSQTLCSATFSPGHGEFLLVSESSQDIVVMSNRLGNTNHIAKTNVTFSILHYAQYQEREYRVIEERVENEDKDDYSVRQRLLFYLPLSGTPIASTDAVGSKVDISIHFAEEENDEDICYYIDDVDGHYILCGWGLESNQKVFEYNGNFASIIGAGDILGFPGGQILYLDPDGSLSHLHLIDPVKRTERIVSMEGHSLSGALSEDGKYAAVIGRDATESTIQLYLVDVENWEWVEVPEELQGHPFHGYVQQYYYTAGFSQDSSKLAIWLGDEIVILNLTTMTISHVQIPCSHCGYSMFLNDHILLVYGDSGHLTTWDLNTQSIVMKDPYDDITEGSVLWLGDRFFQAGDTYQSNLYTYDEDGRFARYLSVHGIAYPTGSEVLIYNDYFRSTFSVKVNDLIIYPLYSLDELVAMANEILDGKTLTESERIQYFID